MNDRPYTDEDLRAEAARQHYIATEDPDFMGIGEQMDDRYVRYEVVDPEHGDLMPPAGTPRWDELDEGQFEEAQRQIHDLITGAADVSSWAVDLGADGLEPSERSITLGGTEQPTARIHFAFGPGMPDELRTALVEGLAEAIDGAVINPPGA